MNYNRQLLIEKYPDPPSIPFLFFWGHQPSADGSITQSCLSQWWPAPFEVDGIAYPTAEHWMMAGKARLFSDEAACRAILACSTPAEVKEQGRLVKNFDPVVWDKHKYEIVVRGNAHKFYGHRPLMEYLLSTGNQVLVEASPTDKVWGIGMGAMDKDARNPAEWKGENLLGFALMEIRYNFCF